MPKDVTRLRRQYIDYLDAKRDETDEQKMSRRYYHGDQWTRKELLTLKKRRQPPTTNNLVARKCNAIVGLIERMRQDPKAYPRTPQHQEGSDLATAVIRFVLDNNDWNAKSPEIALDGAVDGIGGIAFEIEDDGRGDQQISFETVDPESFFYDPRSFKADFSDARFLGIAKWMDAELAKELFPEHADYIDGIMKGGSEGSYALEHDSDRERKWFDTNEARIRLVEHWYVEAGQWYYAYYVGTAILAEGQSPFVDEKNKSFHRFVMYSSFVDHEGDRYGFVRNMKSPQDQANHHTTKGIHVLNSRRIIADKGSVDDVEKARAEWARPDGWIEKNPAADLTPDDRTFDLQGQLLFLEKAENQISSLAPDPASLAGETGSMQARSGRAIQLLQQAGMAELGPFILAYRGWKIRVYRAIWNIVQRLWTGERYIRVTDDEDVAQFIQINGLEVDEYGRPQMFNQLGALDVDIILDEGPDTINMMQDTLDMVIQSGIELPPDIFIELMPMKADLKKRLLERMQNPAPEVVQAQQLELQARQVGVQKDAAEVEETESKTLLNRARSIEAMAKAEDQRELQLTN